MVTADDLLTMGFSFGAEPFIAYGPTGIDFGNLGWNFGAEPFYAYSTSVSAVQRPGAWVAT